MKSPLWIVGLLIAAGLGWYAASPLYTLGQMRAAATAGDAAKLGRYVDYAALKRDLDDDLRREIVAEGNRRGAASDPLTRALTELAVAVVRPGVELLATPAAVQAMFDTRAAGNPGGSKSATAGSARGGMMSLRIPKSDALIERRGIDGFAVSVKGKPGAAVFRRYGLGWKLVGVDLPPGFVTGAK